ncbi:MAG: hypothetical protein EBS69_08495, partial [Verrucomicrobia bacterium]|nr:hypothetical protein [Verrucomicrobiota bacterium]
VPDGDRMLLFFASRDPAYKVQLVGVASAPIHSDFSRSTWTQLVDAPVLKPELPWEKMCLEAPSILRQGKTLYMFYAGAYNNEPQQIGVATSEDGIHWKRMSDQPLLTNGKPGEWNESESDRRSDLSVLPRKQGWWKILVSLEGENRLERREALCGRKTEWFLKANFWRSDF